MRTLAEQAAPGEHEVVAGHDPAQQARQHVLRGAAAVAVGGLDQRAAGLDEHPQLVRRGVAVGVVAPGHRAQADAGHLQPAAAHPSSLHARSLKNVEVAGRAARPPWAATPSPGNVGPGRYRHRP